MLGKLYRMSPTTSRSALSLLKAVALIGAPRRAAAFSLKAALPLRGALGGRGMCASPRMAECRTRFAPSPTGSLHVGGARTALFSWLKARQETDGRFLVRVEDTDTARSTRESEASVLADLRWLGLLWDEGPEVGGDCGPYRQSERTTDGTYEAMAQKLLESGHAYPCFCTAEELETKRKLAEAAGGNPQYDGTWRDADPEEVKRRMEAGEPYTVRFKVPRGAVVSIDDAVRGEVSWDVASTVGDFILLRSGGMPVYNFCVAVDDAQMGVSTVIRAEEHLTNTVRQVLILEALGYTPPKYAHLSLVLGEDRSKLSKRHGATSVNQFKEEGFLPAAMINYLCNLGWNDGTEQEIYTVEELIDAFSLDRVTKSPAVFDLKKLRWINGQHLRALPTDELAGLVGEHLRAAGVSSGGAGSPFARAAAAMVSEKVELVNDAEALVVAALTYPLEETMQTKQAAPFVADGLAQVGRAVLDAHRDGSLPDPASEAFAEEWKAWVKGVGKALGRKGKNLFQPLRIALTGRTSGPDIPAQIALLALAPAEAQVPAVPLEERMAALELALGALPAPAAAA